MWLEAMIHDKKREELSFLNISLKHRPMFTVVNTPTRGKHGICLFIENILTISYLTCLKTASHQCMSCYLCLLLHHIILPF